MPTTKSRSARSKRPSSSSKGTSSQQRTSGKSSKSSTVRTSSSNRAPRTASMNPQHAANGSANGTSMSNNSGLEKLMMDSLKDIYWAEKHLTKALPKMQKAATTDELKSAIEEHLSQTEEHVSRLEQVFEIVGKKAQAKKCDAMEGLIKEGESVIEETEKGTMTRDAGIIMAAQKVEHYEIATYGTLVQFAKTLGMKEAAKILMQTLDEEKQTDEILTQIAESNINEEAEQENEEEESKEGESEETESEEEEESDDVSEESEEEDDESEEDEKK
ncbi:MAG: ferritin-like domain-containing protein [Bacteroidetes bacterium]|nr:MAG: ferritin-like domain-containing protein [Bacteroidota bacterium]